MNLDYLKSKLSIDISDDLLLRIIFEMNRFFDKKYTNELQIYQKENDRIFNQNERNLLRKYYYYGLDIILEFLKIESFPVLKYTKKDSKAVYSDCLKRLKTYNEEHIILSIIERYNNIIDNKIIDNSTLWLDYYKNKVSNEYKYSFFILKINQNDFIKNNYDINYYCSLIAEIYDGLENYRHIAIKIENKIYDKNNIDITWKLIYKLGIFCENFIQYEEAYFPFKKSKSIEKLSNFIRERYSTDLCDEISTNFYNNISTGFKFEDCFVSNSGNNIILIYKKIKLDNSPVPCPSCMTTLQSGNSYPEMFLRSYECKNPSCPDRSKSGRGKRFDEFGIYRYFKLVEDNIENKISYELYEKWRRDIFDDTNDIDEMLLKYYSWDQEVIAYYNDNLKSSFKRKCVKYVSSSTKNNYIKSFENLSIKILFDTLKNLEPQVLQTELLNDDIIIQNCDSTKGISKIFPNQIGTAITSPPYYNAREYSQWSTLILYLIDMMKNAIAINNVICQDGYYLYNIGDIVNTDNIYVESNMSKHRLQLGFLSCMIFEIAGFNLEGNIIWDKGQVQSKRNSTVNLNSGYIKCINCYEHVFVFKKGDIKPNAKSSYIKTFSPVIKINSKGENLYKHTAPYPPEMVDLLIPYINKDKYILDPFLGSGTTLKWCKEHNYKGIGFELNKEYYNLCIERIYKEKQD